MINKSEIKEKYFVQAVKNLFLVKIMYNNVQDAINHFIKNVFNQEKIIVVVVSEIINRNECLSF